MINERFDFEGRVVVVTGGGMGIGRVYAQEFARAGARVVAADIDAGAANDVAAQIVAAGGQALGVEVDISDEAACHAMANAATHRFGGVDILINNASLMNTLPRGPWTEISVKDWDTVMAVNLRGMFLCCRAVFPSMRDRRYGKIVNISSNRVWEGSPNRLHYTTSKAGVIGFTRALARELGEVGVTVNAVTPGFTLSDTQIRHSGEDFIKQMQPHGQAIPRLQVPEDLVGAVMFLASRASDFMTGQTLNVDGGRMMH